MSATPEARRQSIKSRTRKFESASASAFFPTTPNVLAGTARNVWCEIQQALLNFAGSHNRTAPEFVIWSNEDPVLSAMGKLGWSIPHELAYEIWKTKGLVGKVNAIERCRQGYGCIVVYMCGKNYETVTKSRSYATRFPSTIKGSCVMYRDWSGVHHLLNRCDGHDCHWMPKNTLVEKRKYRILDTTSSDNNPVLHHNDAGPDGFTTNVPRVLSQFEMWWSTYKLGLGANCSCTYQLRQMEYDEELIPVGHRIWKCPKCR